MMLDATQRYTEPLTEERLFCLARGVVSDRTQRYDENHGRRMARRQVRPDASGFRARSAKNASTMKRRGQGGSSRK